jgi:hypothetical protein
MEIVEESSVVVPMEIVVEDHDDDDDVTDQTQPGILPVLFLDPTLSTSQKETVLREIAVEKEREERRRSQPAVSAPAPQPSSTPTPPPLLLEEDEDEDEDEEEELPIYDPRGYRRPVEQQPRRGGPLPSSLGVLSGGQGAGSGGPRTQTVSPSNRIPIVDKANENEEIVHIHLPLGHYKSREALVEMIRAELEREVATHGLFSLELMNDGRLKIVGSPEKVGIRFNDDLHDVLGLANQLRGVFMMREGNTMYYEDCGPIELGGGLDYFLVYSDISETVRVSHQSGRVLRCIDSKGIVGSSNNDSDTIAINFPNIYYVPVVRSQINSISISIRSDFGQLVRFTRGKTVAVLHFRRSGQSL